MHKVLLRQLQQEISAEPNVEVNIALRSFCLGDMKIECLIEQFNRLLLILLLSPADDGLEIGIVWSLCMVLADLHQKFKLLYRVFELVLLDLAINHTVEWGLVCFIV